MELVTSSTTWPDATNTGVPLGTTLTPSGPLTITTSGIVISGLDMTGMVEIQASNVALENCEITSTGFAAVVAEAVVAEAGVAGVVIQNCGIDGEGLSNPNTGTFGIYIEGERVTVSNCNIYGVVSGVTIGGGPALIENNYIHDLNASPGTHYNGIQYNGGDTAGLIDIEHNTIINQNKQTDAVMIDSDFGPVNGVTINNNLLVDGDYTATMTTTLAAIQAPMSQSPTTHLGTGLYGYTPGSNPEPKWLQSLDAS